MSPDEACTNYSDLLTNFELGTHFLKEEFGVEVKIGWQLDPFGHSAAFAKLLSEMGCESMVFSRLNQEKYEELHQNQGLQFNWKP